MASNNEDTLYRDFRILSGEQSASLKSAEAAYQELALTVTSLASVLGSSTPAETPTSVTPAVDNTKAYSGAGFENSGQTNTGQMAGLATLVDLISTSTPTSSTATSQGGSNMQAVLTQPLTEIVTQLRTYGTQSTLSNVLSAPTSEEGRSTVGTITNVASAVFQNTLSPVLRALIGLFTGSDEQPEPALVKYALPPSLQFQGALTPGGISNVDYDQSGLPRAYRDGDSSSASGVGAPQVTVNVQAMDARSFLDHSSEIAAAVRDAILNLSSLNDVVSDL
jgi:hypothetical protein